MPFLFKYKYINFNKCYTADKKSHYNELSQKYKEKPEGTFL